MYIEVCQKGSYGGPKQLNLPLVTTLDIVPLHAPGNEPPLSINGTFNQKKDCKDASNDPRLQHFIRNLIYCCHVRTKPFRQKHSEIMSSIKKDIIPLYTATVGRLQRAASFTSRKFAFKENNKSHKGFSSACQEASSPYMLLLV